MSARAIAGGTISFGLVTVPVKLYSATQASAAGVHFNLLHKECGTRLKQQYICPRDQVVVPREDMIKGYEFARDQFVTFTTEELKALEERATQTIDITEFVPLDKVDPVYFDKPYYLAPDKGGEKAYHLLADVMRSTGRCALAKYAARGKQYLVMLRPGEKGLVMQQLLYADEVRSFADVAMPDRPPIRDAEMKLAEQLVAQISTDHFDPSAYEDEVKKRIQADVQKKVEGQQIEVSVAPEAPAQVIDLMEALKASLGAGRASARATTSTKATEDAAPRARARKPARRTEATSPEADEAKPAPARKRAGRAR